MAKQERTKKSSVQNKVKSFLSASEEILPSTGLDCDELERFDAIIASRERETWTPADRNMATKLAELEVEWHREREVLRDEGTVIGEKANPRVKVCEGIFTQINRMRRDLGLSASQRAISGHKQAKRNQQDHAAAEKIASIGSLIARPNGKA